MGEAARRRVVAKFAWRRVAERHVDAYRELVAERKHARGNGHKLYALPSTTATAGHRVGNGTAYAARRAVGAVRLSEATSGADDRS